MATVPFQPSAPINGGSTHFGLERITRIGHLFTNVYAYMLAAQARRNGKACTLSVQCLSGVAETRSQAFGKFLRR
jgi:hypothetical protein